MRGSFFQRLHARVYANSWKNPLFADPKIKERATERTRYVLYSLLILVSLVAFLSAGFWFATQSRFAIFEVQVTGMRSLPNEKIALHMFHVSHSCTHLFAPCLYRWNISPEFLIKELQDTYHLESASATIQDHRLVLELHEAVTMIPLRIHDQIWFATLGGVLDRKATAEDLTAGVIIPSDTYTEIDVSTAVKGEGASGMQILDPQTFHAIALYKQACIAAGIPLTSFMLTDDRGKIIANTQGGFAIYFTPWENAEVQIRRLTQVLAQTTPQSYVDVRFGERIYVK